jgi:hypothetical protein
MELKELKAKAKKLGIKPKPDTKREILIRSIQAAEGNFPCFDTGNDSCDQLGCCWRNDCLTPLVKRR